MRARVFSTAVALVLLAASQSAVVPQANAAEKPKVPAVQKYRPAPAHRVALHRQTSPRRTAAAPGRLQQRGSLPRGWEAVTTISAAGNAQTRTVARSGNWNGLPLLRLNSRSKPAATTRYRVKLLNPASAQKLGASLVFTVTQEAGTLAGSSLSTSLDYTLLKRLMGPSWVSRLQLATLPACAVTSPTKPACRVPTPLNSSNDVRTRSLTATLAAPASAARARATTATSVVAATTGPGGTQGDYTATNLASTGSWSHGGSSGTFNWGYPIAVPSSAAGQAPSVSIGYNSATVDGYNSNSNPQSSWLGTGFDYQPGYIERTFRNCKEANSASTDKGLCWAGDILTMHLPGGATQALVVDSATGKIRPESDSGERIERLTGASNGSTDKTYWRVTTTDGTRYTFGLNILPGGATANATQSAWNVPVYGGPTGDTCASSRCIRTWRWNLDMVEDVHANTSAYYYAKEANYFVPSGTTTRQAYDRAGYLARIDYGLINNGTSIYSTTPSHRINFNVVERCLTPNANGTCPTTAFTAANSSNWPDVPMDQYCPASGGTCNINWPTFWTTKKLLSITSSYRVGAAYQAVDTWTFGYTWSKSPSTDSLNLASITRTASPAGAKVVLPPVTFGYATLDSRVVNYKSYPDMAYDRLTQVVTETGVDVRVTYLSMDAAYNANAPVHCTATTVPATPSDNSTTCFPVNWTQPFQTTPTLDYFHSYPVVAVDEYDKNGLAPSRHTEFKYSGPGWHYDENEIVKPARRTWGQWRGYRSVETLTGDKNWNFRGANDQQTRSVTTYYTGMDGDKLPTGTRSVSFRDSRATENDRTDIDALAGMVAETRVFGGTTELSSTRNSPAVLSTTAVRTRSGMADLKATVTGIKKTIEITDGTGPGTTDLTQTTTTDFAPASAAEPFIQRPATVTVAATGGTGTSAGSCTKTTYADNTTTWVRDTPAEVTAYASSCDSGSLITQTRSYYDGKTVLGGGNVTLGDVTKTETASTVEGANNSTHYITNTNTYDARGRVKSRTAYPDGTTKTATARTTTLDYTINTDGILTDVVTTLPTRQQATGPAPVVTTKQTFDPARGMMVRSTDVAGRVTSATIDGIGRYTSVWRPGRVQDTDSASTTFSYQLAAGSPPAITSRSLVDAGNGTTPSYDTSTQIFDAFGNIRQTQADATGGGRAIADSFVDSHGWVVGTNDRWFTSGAPSTTIVATSDSYLDSRTITRYDAAGRPTQAQSWRGTDPQPVDTTYTIYGGDRVTVIPPPGGTAQTTLSNGLGQTTELRRYTDSVTPSTFGGAPANVTQYKYGANGKLSELKTAVGTSKVATWSYGYDLAGRMVASNDPDAGSSTTKYDDTGSVTETTDAVGRVVSTTYDAWARPTGRYAGTAGTGAQLASWTYDTTVVGEPASSTSFVANAETGTTDTFTTTVLGYSPQGLPTATELKLTVPGLFSSYTSRMSYTSTGLVATSTLASTYDSAKDEGNPAEKLTHWYDRLGQQTGLTGTNVYLSGATYSPYREVSQLVLGVNSATTGLTYTRDPHYRWVTNTQLTGQLADPQIANIRTTRDLAGKITRTVDTQGGTGAPVQTTCYAYDQLQQLTDAWAATDNCAAAPATAPIGGVNPFRQHWTYDAAGSRETQTAYAIPGSSGANAVTTYTNGVTGHAHALSNAATTGNPTPSSTGVLTTLPASLSATYNQDGATDTSTTPDGTTKYEYRPDGSLGKITSPAGATTFVNDASGNRLLRIEKKGSVKSTTLYLPGQQVTTITDDATTTPTTTTSTTRYYTLLSGQQIAVRKARANPVFTLGDDAGTTHLTFDPFSDPTAPPTVRRDFDPFGNELGTSTPTNWVDDRTFLNKPSSSMSGLTDLAARQYDSRTGRFASVDPVMDPASPTQANGYNYANNDPINRSDPDGLAPRCVLEGTCRSETNSAGGVAVPTRNTSTATRDPRTGEVSNVSREDMTSAKSVARAVQVRGGDDLIEINGGYVHAGEIIASYLESKKIYHAAPPLVAGLFALIVPDPGQCFGGNASAGGCLLEAAGFIGVGKLGKLAKAADAFHDAEKVAEAARAAKAAKSADHVLPIGPGSEKAWTVLNRIDAKGAPLPGYKGGSVFKNAQGRLPEKPGVTYREWDVNPYTKGVNRGAERIVTGSDGSAYWTGDHYDTFLVFRGPTG